MDGRPLRQPYLMAFNMSVISTTIAIPNMVRYSIFHTNLTTTFLSAEAAYTPFPKLNKSPIRQAKKVSQSTERRRC
jgi:hypothetical protein